MKKIKMFTHTDLDGIGCGLVSELMLRNTYISDIQYANYNEINAFILDFINKEEYKGYDYIFITDISVNEDVAKKINEINSEKNKFILIDHHETSKWLNKYSWAKVQSEVNLFADKFKKVSGTYLFALYLKDNFREEIERHNYYQIISFILSVDSYDTWNWKEIDDNCFLSKELNDLFYILGRKRFIDIIFMDISKGMEIKEIIEKFSLLLELEEDKKRRYIKSKSESIIEKEFIVEDKIYKFGVVFAEQFVSELGNKLNELNPQYDFIMIIGDGKVSLRTIYDEIKVNEIAELFGGGGHPKASGFEYNKSIKNRIIFDILTEAGTN